MNAPSSASGSTPPSSVSSSMTGNVAATRARTGAQPRRELAQHDLAVGQVRHEQVRQGPPGSVQADRPGGRGRRGQQHQRQLRPDHRHEEAFAELRQGSQHRRAGHDDLRSPADPDHEEGGHQAQDEQRPPGIGLPSPRGGDPLVDEDGPRSETAGVSVRSSGPPGTIVRSWRCDRPDHTGVFVRAGGILESVP